MHRSIWMKDGFLILIKSLAGGGGGDQDCGKEVREQKNEVMKIRVLQALDSDPCGPLPTQHILCMGGSAVAFLLVLLYLSDAKISFC